jgi:hypothetical protein
MGQNNAKYSEKFDKNFDFNPEKFALWAKISKYL